MLWYEKFNWQYLYIGLFFSALKEGEFIFPHFYPLKFTVVQLKQALRTVLSIICHLLPST